MLLLNMDMCGKNKKQVPFFQQGKNYAAKTSFNQQSS